VGGVLSAAAVCATIVWACSSYESATDAPDGGRPDASDAPDAPGAPDATDANVPSFRRAIHIQARGSALPVGYTIGVPIDLGVIAASGHAAADFGDVVVAGAAGEQARVIDPSPPFPTFAVWFALRAPIAAGATDDTYELRYGGARATKLAGSDVFPIWDDFKQGALADRWTVYGDAWIDGGAVVGDQDAGMPSAIISKSAPSATSALDIVARFSAASAANGYWLGYQTSFGGGHWLLWLGGTGAIHASSNDSCPNACTGPDLGVDTAAHVFHIERMSNATTYALDGQDGGTTPNTNTDVLDVNVENQDQSGQNFITVTLVRARALVDEAPVVTIGDEEAKP
jgi:hypothetical protein